ncbi:MAG TPA: hypothetical protein VLH35_02960 [Candidatus Acidoferrales bacterium]|nr:hypothetical protein [Candidatus Acidoferrales bacterium]
MAKERPELPFIKEKNMKDYLDATFPDIDSASRIMCEYAFRHWQMYLNEYNYHRHEITKSDITAFNSLLLNKKLEPVTTYNYFGQLERFFRHEKYSFEVLEHTHKLKVDYKSKIRQNYFPLRYKHLQDLYEIADLEDKLLIQILLREKVLISDIPNVIAIEESNTDNFDFSIGKTRLDFHKATIEAAKAWLRSEGWLNSKKREDRRLFRFRNRRSIGEHLDALEVELLDKKQIALGYPLYSKSMQKYGHSLHIDDIAEVLKDTSN